jgi:AbrB family looped-hinge helix DNA binding protein
MAYDGGVIDREHTMPTVTVSPKFQVVIPQEVREALAIRPGEKLQVFQFNNRIELVPVRPIREMRGFLRGIDTNLERDPDRL